MDLNDTPSQSFVWSTGEADYYDFNMELTYYFGGQEYSHEEELEDVEVKSLYKPPPKNETPPGPDDPSFFESPAFFAMVAVAGVGAIGALVYVVKRE